MGILSSSWLARDFFVIYFFFFGMRIQQIPLTTSTLCSQLKMAGRESPCEFGVDSEETIDVDSEETIDVDSSGQPIDVDSSEQAVDVDLSEQIIAVNSLEQNIDVVSEQQNLDVVSEQQNIDVVSEQQNINAVLEQQNTDVESSEQNLIEASEQNVGSWKLRIEDSSTDQDIRPELTDEKIDSAEAEVEPFLPEENLNANNSVKGTESQTKAQSAKSRNDQQIRDLDKKTGMVTGKMKNNLDEIMKRDVALDDLEETAGGLAREAKEFHQTSKKVSRKMWCQNHKWSFIIAAAVVVVIAGVAIAIAGSMGAFK